MPFLTLPQTGFLFLSYNLSFLFFFPCSAALNVIIFLFSSSQLMEGLGHPSILPFLPDPANYFLEVPDGGFVIQCGICREWVDGEKTQRPLTL